MNADVSTDGRCRLGVSVNGVFATPKVRGLFEEWVKAVEEEILELLKEKGSCDPSEISAKLKMSEESAIFFIGKMAKEKKVKIAGGKL